MSMDAGFHRLLALGTKQVAGFIHQRGSQATGYIDITHEQHRTNCIVEQIHIRSSITMPLNLATA